MSGPTVVETYPYVDENGRLLYEVERFKPKGFRQKRRVLDSDGSAREVFNLDGVRRVLYRLPQVLHAAEKGRPIWICAGEKDANAVEATGRVATCNAGGEGNWLPEYTETLRGCTVCIIADNDRDLKGAAEALKIAVELEQAGIEVKMYQPPRGIKDAFDLIKRNESDGCTGKQALRGLRSFDRAAAQEALGNRRVKRRELTVMSAKEFCARPGLNGSLRALGPLLYATMRTALLGSKAVGGDGKTTMCCQMIRAVTEREEFMGWQGSGGRALIVDVEQGEETVKQRLREFELEHNPNIDILWEPDGVDLDIGGEDRRGLERLIRQGRYKVALFDPLYKLHRGDPNSERIAVDIMDYLDDLARRYELAILIPCHPRKPHPQAGLNHFSANEASGSAAWFRGAEIQLGLQYISHGYARWHFFKDRPGLGPPVGTWWGLLFDPATHRFRRDPNDENGKPATRVRVKPLVKESPGITTSEVAEQVGVTVQTANNALLEAGFHHIGSPVEQRQWFIEAQPESQLSLGQAALSEERVDGSPSSA